MWLPDPRNYSNRALDAVRQWTYKPFLVNGEPVEVKTTINVIYTLAHSESIGRPKRTKRAGTDPQPSLCLLDSAEIRPVTLQRLNVRSLPSLWPLHHVELHGLTFLQALETT